MALFQSEHTRVRKAIAALEMTEYVEKAKELFGLIDADIDQAVAEYRHFLYLLYWNRREGNRLPVVPTKRADHLWHAHLLFNGEYNPFCIDVYGEIIAHHPGLKEGSDPFIAACLHTKQLHDRVGDEGFDVSYFSFIETQHPAGKQGDTRSSAVIAGGCGGVITPQPTLTDTGGDGGDAGGCGSSCGGGSCGGGGCGGGGCGG